uniref:Uncharacterized protein n=1 Tax=Phenylobacterium glaciei TaxID=2803784 RepID=A0A974S7L8_9CAUL|nr:hypothetical protein JKL49_26125 [Phenylobacterium glaciei]
MFFTIGVIGVPSSFISSGIRIIRSPTPASEADVIGLLTASADAPNVRTISLSSAIVADI